MLGAPFHANFDTHLISLNKCLPILNRQMCMAFGELKTTFAIEFLEKGSMSGYSMIIAKVFESVFKGIGVNLKLKVSDNGKDGQTAGLVIPGNVEDNLTFMTV